MLFVFPRTQNNKILNIRQVNSKNQILWKLLDNVKLSHFLKIVIYLFCLRYPLGLGNLGDLEEISPTANRPGAEEILKEGIRVNQTIYKDQHVYPYTYLAGFYHRQKQFMKAMEYWVKAAHVAGK